MLAKLSVVNVGDCSTGRPTSRSYICTNSPMGAKVCGVRKCCTPSKRQANAKVSPFYCIKCSMIAAQLSISKEDQRSVVTAGCYGQTLHNLSFIRSQPYMCSSTACCATVTLPGTGNLGSKLLSNARNSLSSTIVNNLRPLDTHATSG